MGTITFDNVSKTYLGQTEVRALDGISLTIARWQDNIAEVAVIPYTYLQTNIRDRKPGDAVNLEGDVLGKYVERYLQAGHYAREPESQLTVARLIEEGF